MFDLALKFLCASLSSVAVYMACVWVYKKVRSPLLNPLLISTIFLVICIVLAQIEIRDYEEGTQAISFFLGPATVALAYSVYVQWKLLKENFLPILVGCFVGSVVSIVSAHTLCTLFGFDQSLTASFIPKSVTMPIALTITDHLGGIGPITVAAVVFTGILGAVFSPVLIKVFKIKNKIACGLAIGTSSHALGTTKAVELGELEGAMSGVAIAMSGLITTALVLLADLFI